MTGTGLQGVKRVEVAMTPNTPCLDPVANDCPALSVRSEDARRPHWAWQVRPLLGTVPTHHVRTGEGGSPQLGRHGTYWVSAQ